LIQNATKAIEGLIQIKAETLAKQATDQHNGVKIAPLT